MGWTAYFMQVGFFEPLQRRLGLEKLFLFKFELTHGHFESHVLLFELQEHWIPGFFFFEVSEHVEYLRFQFLNSQFVIFNFRGETLLQINQSTVLKL